MQARAQETEPAEEASSEFTARRRPRGLGAVEFVNLNKSYYTNSDARNYVVRDANCLFPAGRKVALLGSNGAGKSTLLRMISGAQDCDSGQILRYGTVSWPIGFGGSFHGELTGAQNTKFVARVHGIDTEAMKAFVHEFTELGDAFFMPFRTYSSGMRARLAFAVSMGVPFDCYLIDEVTSVGDARFRDKAAEVFQTRLRDASAIMASHGMSLAKNMCDMGAVLHEGKLAVFEDVDEAIELHKENMASKK